jgi:hypothetical protein
MKKVRQVKSNAKSMLTTICFDIKDIVHKEFILAGQTIISAYYCDILQQLLDSVLRLCLELWRQKNWLLHHDNTPSNTSFSTREFFTKNNMTVIPLCTLLTSLDLS